MGGWRRAPAPAAAAAAEADGRCRERQHVVLPVVLQHRKRLEPLLGRRLLVALLAAFFAANMDVPPANAIAAVDGAAVDGAARTFEPRGVTALDTGVFVIGCIPFVWATWEFWRRIAVGASFGTGKGAIVFSTDDDPDEDQVRRFGGRRVLGKGALAVAYVLFAAAGGSVLLAVVAALQV